MQENLDLEKLLADYQSINHAKKYLIKLEQRLEEEKLHLEDMASIVEKEYQDVKKLESLSLTSLFQTLLGKKEEQYEIERQEYLHAVMKYNECKKMVDLLRFDLQILQEKVGREQAVYQQLTALLTERNRLVQKKYAGLKKQITKIHEQIDKKITFKQEVGEALSVNLEAADLIQRMIELVITTKNAEDWNGSALNNPAEPQLGKYTYIDQAQQLSYKVRKLFLQLEVELEDVYQLKSVKRINKVAELQNFNVIYYDYLISDWIIRRQINSTLNYLYGVRDTLALIEQTMKAQLQTTEQAIDQLKKQKQQIILNA